MSKEGAVLYVTGADLTEAGATTLEPLAVCSLWRPQEEACGDWEGQVRYQMAGWL